MEHRRKNLVLAAMVFAVAMTFIDQTIVAIAIPNIQSELSLSATGSQWVINGYLLALSALFAFGGKLGDVLGRRRMVVLGVIGFALASACCGLTPKGSDRRGVDHHLPRAPGRHGGADVPRRGGDRGRLVPAARARPGDGDLLRGLRRPDRDRADRRRLSHPVDVAGDLLDQHPGGDRRAGPDLAFACPTTSATRRRLDYRGTVLITGGDGPDRAGLPAVQRLGLEQRQHVGLHGRRPGADGRVRGVGAARPEPLLRLQIFSDRGFAADTPCSA